MWENENMEKQRREKALVVVVLLVVIAGLTVAFAALSTTLNINGTAYLDAAKWGIRFENLSIPTKIGSATITGTAKIEETNSASITGMNVSLSTPGDKVTYTVDLVNKGTINAKIDKIEKTALTEEQQKYLTFKVTDKDGKEVSEGDILQKGETKKLIITIEFIKDLTKEDLPN
ncbi:unknown [Clostridium sp. CAG:594]|nr:unknown [Clostridium sp. CAG:594]